MFMMIRISDNQPTPVDQDRAGPSDVPSFSDTLRTRLQSASMKYPPNPLGLLAYVTLACEILLVGIFDNVQVQGFYIQEYKRMEGKVVCSE